MVKQLKQIWQDESGSSATEYALMIGALSVGMIVGLTALGDAMQSQFSGLADTLDGSGSGGPGTKGGTGTLGGSGGPGSMGGSSGPGSMGGATPKGPTG